MAMLSVRRATSVQIGVTAAVLMGGAAGLLFLKTPIQVALRSGDEVKVQLGRDYKIHPDLTKVKIAGVPVGVVTNVRRTSSGAEMTLKVDKNVRRTLGSAPSAAVRPTTILGGNYYVELTPGGDRDVALSSVIPASRTTVPVELDAVTGMFDGNARNAIRSDVKTIDSTFNGPATQQLHSFVTDSPDALQSSSKLLAALAGTAPSTDLTRAVTGFESTTRQLDSEQQDFRSAISGFASFSKTLDARKGSISQTVVAAPAALRNAREGLTALSGLLDQVTTTARSAGPSVTALSSLLQNGKADLDTLRPVVHDLRPLLVDLDPTVSSAVPFATHAQQVINDVKSPVITRISGPLIGTLVNPVHGQGSPLTYQQIAYMFTLLNLNSMTTDHNGAMINFQPGVGPDTTTQFGTAKQLVTSWQQLLSTLPRSTR